MEYSDQLDTLRAQLAETRNAMEVGQRDLREACEAKTAAEEKLAEVEQEAREAKKLHDSDMQVVIAPHGSRNCLRASQMLILHECCVKAMEARVEAKYASQHAQTLKAAFSKVEAETAARMERGTVCDRLVAL